MGIPPELQPRVFERFFALIRRARATLSETAVAPTFHRSLIAELHGGNVVLTIQATPAQSL
jgi:signal transduction histidine kinase